MKKILFIIMILGIALRFTLQFVFPSFNVDEISLASNFYKTYYQLLFPLDNLQSSPPLYLWTQKTIISFFPFSFWVNVKILSFISSSLGLYFFYRLILKSDIYLAIFMMVLFTFNPYIIYNSLTVKQYTIDLLGILILLNFYKDYYFLKFNAIFFCIWSLFSNLGLFGVAGFLVFQYFILFDKINFSNIILFTKKNIFTFISTLPYMIYFSWFMNQKGSAE